MRFAAPSKKLWDPVGFSKIPWDKGGRPPSGFSLSNEPRFEHGIDHRRALAQRPHRSKEGAARLIGVRLSRKLPRFGHRQEVEFSGMLKPGGSDEKITIHRDADSCDPERS